MPVENSGLIFPKADVQFQAPEGPETVEFDDGTAHVGEGDAPETPVTVDHSELHQPSSTDQFEAPSEPVTVVQPGYEVQGIADERPADAEPGEQIDGQGAEPAASDANAELQKVTDDLTAAVADLDAAEAQGGKHEAPEQPAAETKTPDGAQTKVVTPPVDQPAAGTDGAQTK